MKPVKCVSNITTENQTIHMYTLEVLQSKAQNHNTLYHSGDVGCNELTRFLRDTLATIYRANVAVRDIYLVKNIQFILFYRMNRY